MGWNDIVLTKLLLLQPGVCPNNKQWCEVDCGKIAASASASAVVVVVVGVCTADADTCCTIRLFDNKNGSSDYDVALFVAVTVIKVSRGYTQTQNQNDTAAQNITAKSCTEGLPPIHRNRLQLQLCLLILSLSSSKGAPTTKASSPIATEYDVGFWKIGG
eukprot:scaffold7951_cov80-Skeletonema_marinoi.AAC.6